MSGIKERVTNFAKSNSFLWFIYRCFRWIKRRVIRCAYVCCDIFRKKNRYCIICSHKAGKFLSAGELGEIFRKHHIIGGGLRDNCTCIYCGSGDRERWQYYVLKNHTDILTSTCTVLHFAAESSNSKLIRSNRNCKYITADITPGRGDYAVDMTDMKIFGDKMFDYIIANHVLEHIQNESAAISELKRVLKDDGTIILSFPVCTDMLTYEDDSVTTEEGRWNAFGQGDHVRLYGTDYKERLEGYALNVKVCSPQDEFSMDESDKYGFIYDDVSIFCTIKH